MKARKRNPTKAVMAQFFEVDDEYELINCNCIHCGAFVDVSMHVRHVEWHLRLTKIIEGKRDKL